MPHRQFPWENDISGPTHWKLAKAAMKMEGNWDREAHWVISLLHKSYDVASNEYCGLLEKSEAKPTHYI